MRVSFSIVLVALSLLTLTAQTKNEEEERKRISESNIKAVTQWTHRYTGGELNPKGYKTTETYYDKSGNPIEIINYRSNGDISSRLLYKYNSDNQRTEYIMYQKIDKPVPEVSYKQSIHYNSKGVKTVESIFDGATGYRVTYDYFPNDNLKEIVKYGVGNKVDERWVYSYDGNNEQISIYIPDKTLNAVVNKKLNSDGNLLEEYRVNAEGKELKKIISKYDTKGREVEMSEYYSGKLIKMLQYFYNNVDLLVEVIQHNPDGSKFIQSKYNYDLKGNLLEEQWSEGQQDEFSRKQSTYSREGRLVETDQYFAPYRYRVLYKYSYEYYK